MAEILTREIIFRHAQRYGCVQRTISTLLSNECEAMSWAIYGKRSKASLQALVRQLYATRVFESLNVCFVKISERKAQYCALSAQTGTDLDYNFKGRNVFFTKICEGRLLHLWHTSQGA